MNRSAPRTARSPRRLSSIVLVGLPLAFGAAWLAPTAMRWAKGSTAEEAAAAPHATASSAVTSGQTVGQPQPVNPALAAVPVVAGALLPKWEQDVHSRDPAARADALAGLATAPREQAMPILQNLLKDGAYPDRQLVIESLAILARLQGDADERIRTAFRVEIYDGSDEATSSSAQKALADLEEDLR